MSVQGLVVLIARAVVLSNLGAIESMSKRNVPKELLTLFLISGGIGILIGGAFIPQNPNELVARTIAGLLWVVAGFRCL